MDKLIPLYSNYNFKFFQQNLQKIDRHKIISYYIDNYNKSDYKYLIKKSNQIKGIISAARFNYLSGFFKKNIYHLKDFISDGQSPIIYQELITDLLNKNDQIDFLMAKIPIDDYNAVNSLLQNDFYYICIESHLSLCLNKIKNIDSTDFVKIRMCTKKDLPRIQKIASTTHENIRYYYDDYFKKSKVDTLYQQILANGLSNKNYRTFVYSQNKKVIGFITLIFNQNLSGLMQHNYASLDFIGVDKESQQKNIGYILNNYALQYLKDQNYNIISVKTMGSNYRALKLLTKNNFALSSQNIILHRRGNKK